MKERQLANTAKGGQIHSLLKSLLLKAILVLKGTSKGYLNITSHQNLLTLRLQLFIFRLSSEAALGWI